MADPTPADLAAIAASIDPAKINAAFQRAKEEDDTFKRDHPEEWKHKQEEHQKQTDEARHRVYMDQVPAPGAAQKPSDSLKLSGDFNDAQYTATPGKHFDNLNFGEMPSALFSAAQREAEEVMKYAQAHGVKLENTELGQIAMAAGHTSSVTKDELASVLLAESMKLDNQSGLMNSKVSVEFTNHADIDLGKKANPNMDVTRMPPDGVPPLQTDDPHIVFEVARRILQDARPEEISPADRLSPSTATADIASHTYTSVKAL